MMMNGIRMSRMLQDCGLLAGMALCAAAAQAGVVAVTTLDDLIASDGQCSLREAVLKLNGSGGDDCPIVGAVSPPRIELSAGTYQLSIPGTHEDQGLTGDLDISVPIDIRGLGPDLSIIDGDGLDRTFDVHSGGVLRLFNLTVQNGRAPNVAPGGTQRDASGGCVRAADDSELDFNVVVMEWCVAGNGLDVASGTGGRGGQGGAVFGGEQFSWNGRFTGHSIRLEGNFAGQGGFSLDGRGGAGGDGGGISLLGGVAEISDSEVRGNATGECGTGTMGSCIWGDGGGLSIQFADAATIDRSTISHNTAGAGGGLRFTGGQSVIVIGTTITYNVAGSGGGGMITSNTTPVLMANSTIANNTGAGVVVINAGIVGISITVAQNTAFQRAGISVSGAFNDPFAHLFNTISAGNVPNDCEGNVVSGGFNLTGQGTGCPTDGPGDQAVADAGLGPLQNNGGGTQTIQPLPGSPAIDNGSTDLDPIAAGLLQDVSSVMMALLQDSDQRGHARRYDALSLPAPPGDRSDSGAVEVGAPPIGHLFADGFES
ncbi:MAG: hypothetical protein CVV18_00400 [Gammaproteobacteria bacterium HGW-Gammaproteobacteria-8]|nr:MAG: hypothetical protein CVV18_00400 [Gammaproteobacteria bacterium HGW-Gammaproteobacteria-8]